MATTGLVDSNAFTPIEIFIPAEVSKTTDKTTQSLGLCARLAHGTANCVKRFGVGAAAGVGMLPFSAGIPYFARAVGLMPELNREDLIRGTVTNLQNKGYSQLNAEELINAPCYLEEFAKQLNSHFPLNPEVHKTAFSMKVMNVVILGVIAPLMEEVLFRGLIQDVLLTRIPKYVVKIIAPGKETALDSTVAQAARITLTAAAFSAYHLINRGVLADSYVDVQLVATFVLGIGLGILKESKAGLAGSIAAHSVNNMVATAPALWSC